MPIKTSRLCKTLHAILHDTHSSLSLLDYFIQYTESVGALHMVQFWLSVESFRVTAQSPVKPPSPKKPTENRTRSNAIDKNGWSEGVSQLSSEEPCMVERSPEGSRVSAIKKSHEKPYGNSTTPIHSTPQSSNGSPGTHVGSVGDHKDSKSSGSTHSSPGTPGREKHRVLQRRDTENHKYCNCKIHGFHNLDSPPSSHIHGLGCSGDSGQDNACSSPELHNDVHHEAVKSQKEPSPVVNWSSHQPSPRVPGKKGLGGSVRSTAGAYQGNHVQSQHQQHTHKLSLEPDALGIYSNYLALNATKPVGVTDEIRQQVEVNICPEDGKISNSCFDEAQEFVYGILEKRYYPGFLHSAFLCKYQLDYIASGALTLVDFLLGENALFYFMEFMEQEGASSLLQFWLTAENFFNHLSSPDHTPNIDVDTADAIAIYNRYFSLQATEPLNMEDGVRLDVENRICDENGPRPDSFLRPQLVAYHTMNEVYFPAFIGSSIYLRFLDELVQMLNKDDDPAPFTSTSESTTKTSTGVAVLKMSPLALGKDLDDPNSLWERPALLFRLGFVNDLGEYVSDVDQVSFKSPKKEPHAWNVSSRLLKKRKKEEELAMKIARNIIAEVRNCINSSEES